MWNSPTASLHKGAGGKGPEPSPFLSGIRIFPLQGIRKPHPVDAVSPVLLVQPIYLLEMGLKLILEALGK